MIKNSSLRRICVATLALLILLIIYLFPKNDTEESLSYIEKEEIPIFLVDKMDYVARTAIVKESEDIKIQIEEIIDALTINSKTSSYIRDGFKPIIPKDTKLLDFKLENNTLTLNFDKNILNIDLENEEKMIEAIIYSLTEIKEIKKIKILVEGTLLTNLPNSSKKIPEYLDKSFGINKIYNLDSIKDTSRTTIYYISKENDYYYYVPVTKVSNNDTEKLQIIIKELKTTPIYNTNLISYLAASTNLSNYEFLENSINLSFDNHLLMGFEDKKILEEVKYSIALSLRDTYGINEIKFIIPDLENDTIHL